MTIAYMPDEKLDEIIALLKTISSELRHGYSFEIKESIIRGIDNALNGHRGTLDGVDVDRMHKERMNEDLVQKQIAALTVQSQESQKQTQQILRQTKYIIAAFVVTLLASVASTFISALNYQIATQQMDLAASAKIENKR